MSIQRFDEGILLKNSAIWKFILSERLHDSKKNEYLFAMES